MAKETRGKETMRMSMPMIGVAGMSVSRALRRAVALTAVSLLVAVILPVAASASVKMSEFAVGSSTQQAGGHPTLTARFRVEKPGQPEVVNHVNIHMPTGIFGNPGAIDRCSAAIFVVNECAPGSQVGVITVVANYEGNANYVMGTAPIYNLSVLGDEAARLAFVVPIVDVPVVMPIDVRSDSDYGLDISINSIPQTVAVSSASMTIWGFPAAKEHAPERFPKGSLGSPPGCAGANTASCLEAPYAQSGETVKPFIDNPSVCSGELLPVSAEVTTYQDPTPTTSEATYPPTAGCENQKFDPVFQAKLTTAEADAPSGLDLQLKAQQFLAGEAPSQSALRTATVILPSGLSINPDAADGQTDCTEAEAGFRTNLPGACPDNAKIGTLEVHTPALESPLIGSLYIGEPLPGDQYRVFMIFDGYGIHAKLIAQIHPDPVTGQITMTVTDIPQDPFEEFDLHLFASDRGLMATPTQCRVYGAEAIFEPWNPTLSNQSSTPFLDVTEGPHGAQCPGQVRPFNPRLVAGTSNAQAGKFSAFILKLEREDGDQFLSDVNFKMPPGFTGDLRGIAYCPEANILAAASKSGREEQANPSCPATSEIGTTNVAAGPGEHPFHVVGKMYLAGPYKGAPLSLAAITPALAGPYDYGTQVVRVALDVDAHTAQVTAASDPMPQIIGGIPIRMRSIQVNINRPNFTINPTNCSPFAVDSQGIGDQGAVANFSSNFQVVNCATLPFKPRMTITQLGKRKQTRRSKDPSLRFDLWTRSGDANLKSVAVTLPTAWEIDQRHLGNLCSKAQLESERCAGRAAIGTVEDKTPLLERPLKGPAYAVSGYGKLPHLAFILGGQVTVIPEAESSSVKGGRLKTVVPVVPDVPIGHFRLTIYGGHRGYLENTRSLCASTPITTVQYTAQNGKKLTRRVKAKTACGAAVKHKRSRHHLRARRR